MGAEALTRALGGRWHGSYGTARCPAHEDKSPSLSIKDGDDGRLLLHCHAGCVFRDVAEAIRDRALGEFGASQSAVDRRAIVEKLDRSLAELIGIIWTQTRPITGTVAERYLRCRGIAVELPATLRFHARLRHPSGQHLPAIVGRVEHVRDGMVGVHRTYLDYGAARKTRLNPDKAMLGPCKGGAVRLRHGRQCLAVCEGIETALSLAAGLDHGVAVWAALSTSGVAGLALPEKNEFAGKLLIGTDGDSSGRKAGASLADRAILLGWKTEIVNAPDGQDFNDLLQGGCRG